MSKQNNVVGIGHNSNLITEKLNQAKDLILKSISRTIGVRNHAKEDKSGDFIYTDKCFDKTEDAADFGLDAYNLINDFIREELKQEPEVKEGAMCEAEDER